MEYRHLASFKAVALALAGLTSACAVPCVDDGFLKTQQDPACSAVSATQTTTTTETTTTTGETTAVTAPLIVECGAPPVGAEGAKYTHTPSASGGVPSYMWSASGLPEGLAINGFSGAITGAPTIAGDYAIELTVTDSEGTTAMATCPAVTIASGLDVDGDKLLMVYPDGCVPPGVTLQDLIDDGVLVGGDGSAIVCEQKDGLGNGRFPVGVTVDPNDCSIQGTPAASEPYGMHVWITTFIQGSVEAFVPYCTPQADQAPNAYSVTKTYQGVESTLKPGTAKQAGQSASFGDDTPDPLVEVEEVCNAPGCFWQYYVAYNTLSAMATLFSYPNGKLGMGGAFDGFFHGIRFNDPAVSAKITGRHWVVNIDCTYCISDVEADCDSLDKAIANGDGSNYTFGVIVRP